MRMGNLRMGHSIFVRKQASGGGIVRKETKSKNLMIISI